VAELMTAGCRDWAAGWVSCPAWWLGPFPVWVYRGWVGHREERSEKGTRRLQSTSTESAYEPRGMSQKETDRHAGSAAEAD
jgi:hypothetical protein